MGPPPAHAGNTTRESFTATRPIRRLRRLSRIAGAPAGGIVGVGASSPGLPDAAPLALAVIPPLSG